MSSETQTNEATSEWVEYIAQVFSPTGRLSRASTFEYRAEQETMARAVARALENNESLVVEAGTGVGKSLAYLIPAIRYALDQGKKAIISTHTINLQEQLIRKDIPLVQKVWDEEFPTALLKGRQNYLCTSRLERVMAQTGDLFNQGETAELKQLYAWSKTTKEGTLSELPDHFRPSMKVWNQVCSEPHICTLKNCGLNCFYQIAKKKVQEAKVVVLNHTLFFALLSLSDDDLEMPLSENGFIYPNDFVILDEAHTIENIAAQQLGLHVTSHGIKYDLQRLYNPKTRKGLLVSSASAKELLETETALETLDVFFDQVKEQTEDRMKNSQCRIFHPNLTENIASEPLMTLSKSLYELSAMTDNEIAKAERLEYSKRLIQYHAGISEFLDQNQEDEMVYWCDRSGAEGQNIGLHSAPVDVSQKLRRLLFERDRPIILTSATLSTGSSDLNYFRERVGAQSAVPLQIGSPFDFAKQMSIMIAQNMPDPKNDLYEESLAKWLKFALEESQGRAFVLFTGFAIMNRMAPEIEAFCTEKGWDFFIQSRMVKRDKLLNDFKQSGKGVLFGTDSFWTGVDVPGESLSHVIIVKLPFDVPDDPLIQARIEAIERKNLSSFFTYVIPEAIIKMRQGIGRLIRSKKDRGYVTILDSRIVHKNYGKRFMDALPKESPKEYL